MTIDKITLLFPSLDDGGKPQATTEFRTGIRTTLVKDGKSFPRVKDIRASEAGVVISLEGGKTLTFGNVPFWFAS